MRWRSFVRVMASLLLGWKTAATSSPVHCSVLLQYDVPPVTDRSRVLLRGLLHSIFYA